MMFNIKKLNPDCPGVAHFFDSNAVKNVFDHIRNLGLSAAVIFAGRYISISANSISQYPLIALLLGYLLVIVGMILAGLNIFYGYHLMRKTMSLAISFVFFVMSAFFSIDLVLSILLSRGLVLG